MGGGDLYFRGLRFSRYFFFILLFASFIFTPVDFTDLAEVAAVGVREVGLGVFRAAFLVGTTMFFTSSTFFTRGPRGVAMVFMMGFPAT